jgi:hypothetical protein
MVKKNGGPEHKGQEDKRKTWEDEQREKQGGHLRTVDLNFKPM